MRGLQLGIAAHTKTFLRASPHPFALPSFPGTPVLTVFTLKRKHCSSQSGNVCSKHAKMNDKVQYLETKTEKHDKLARCLSNVVNTLVMRNTRQFDNNKNDGDKLRVLIWF